MMSLFKLKNINPMLFISFSALALTGILHELIPYNIYEVLHPLLGYLTIALVISHVKLNWAWIKSNILSKKNK